ncbi:F-box domain containing protein [Pandoravirus dulcis]|uniref:F-box domain containing protein n=1 Tax=Pandoravirus dulcis TaxID=1349409 RepID=S4VXB8_9VIRU|nr:F-box domain containing protein [Pandoravirus dulcis]AGO82726.1 F-box domain containing protein [Pandoravirus dulcis]
MDDKDVIGLSHLPDELLLAVASFLDRPRDLCAWSATSTRHLALIGGDVQLWRRLRDRRHSPLRRADQWRDAVAQALAAAPTFPKPHWRKSIRRRGRDAVIADVMGALTRAALADPWFAQAETALVDLAQAVTPRTAYRMAACVRASISPAPRRLHVTNAAVAARMAITSFVGTDIRLQYSAKVPLVTIRCGTFDGSGLMSGPGLCLTTDCVVAPAIIALGSCVGDAVGLVGVWSRGRLEPQDGVLALSDCGHVYRGSWGPKGPEGRGLLTDRAGRTVISGAWHNGRWVASPRADTGPRSPDGEVAG